MAKEENQNCDGISFDCPAKEDNISTSSSSSTVTDLMEDDASSTGPLFQPSDLMSHLPIKRGLSKYYEGKSQSFKSFGGLKGLEDLAKEEEKNPYKKRMKMGMSHMFCSPRPTIAKKGSSRSRSRSGSLLSSAMVGLARNDLLATCNATAIPIQKY